MLSYEILNVSQVNGDLYSVFDGRDEGGDEYIIDRVEAIGVARVTDTSGVKEETYNVVVGLELYEGGFVILNEAKNYIGMYDAESLKKKVGEARALRLLNP